MGMINYFNFKKINNDKVLIVNDIGNNAFLNIDEFVALLKDRSALEEKKYRELVKKRFILEGNLFVSSDRVSSELRLSKEYLRRSTDLHIFVVTNYCNMNCVYCQAQSEKSNSYGFMDKETAIKSVEIALQSPDEVLTFEMQGGEPLLNFDAIKVIILHAEKNKGNKRIYYTITTNGTLFNKEILDFFEKYKVSVSISLDGTKKIQEHNRPMKNKNNSYEYLESIVPVLNKRNIAGGAVLTTTNYSLDKWREIVDTYYKFGFFDMLIRPLTPLGYANDHWDEVGYSVDQFLEFYRNSLNYILEYNKKGIRMREMHTVFFLNKILKQVSVNYMELRSPCGATLGQIAYNYDGNIYTCDEGRMIAQMGDGSFCIGNVNQNTYRELVSCDNCRAVCRASVLEGLPGCSDCVYMPYCGVCPATTYALEGSVFSRTYNNYRCKLYQGMLDTIFQLLLNDENKRILTGWV